MRDYEREIAKSTKSNPKAFYRYADSRTKCQTGFPDMKCETGDEVTANKDKAELFNKFFSSVYTVDDVTHIPSIPIHKSLRNVLIS